MSRRLPWTKTLNAKLGGGALILLVFSVALIAANTLILSHMRGASRQMRLFAAGATYDYRLLFHAERLAAATDKPTLSRNQLALRETIGAMDARFRALLLGDTTSGVMPISEPSIRAGLERDSENWQTDRKPRLERFLAATPAQRAASIHTLRGLLVRDAADFDGAARHEQEYLRSTVDRAYTFQFVFLGVATLILMVFVMFMRYVSARARALSETADRIASGELELTATVSGQDELAVLGDAFNTMTSNLRRLLKTEREAVTENEQHLWLITSLAELGHAMSGNPSSKQLSERVLAFLCEALDAQVGALYVAESGGEVLRLSGTYATSGDGSLPERFKRGEGLVGQAAEDQRRIVVREVPDDAMRVRWGLGDARPTSLLVVPLVYEDEVRGVIEIASLKAFTERELDLVDRAAANIGLAIGAAETRARAQQLLEESQRQAEELTTQQEELRAVNETLAEQTRTLELQKESLQATETVLRQKAAQLEQASRYKSEFLANMSHELRTPLNSSLILAKLLIDNKQQNLTPEQVKYAENIYSSGNDLLSLINDILDLSKVEAGKIDLNVETVDVARMLRDLEARFEPLTRERRLELSVVVEPGSPARMDTDGQRVQQILTNLLSNAVKFTKQGSIRLSASAGDARTIRFRVADTGIGIPEHQHQAIFDAFRQADGNTNRKYGGTGLGLSICRELAALLGGEIELASAPGQGSTFTLILPVELDAADTSSPSPHAAPSTKQPEPVEAPASLAPSQAAPLIEDDRDALRDQHRIVLVVEDDPAFAGILRDLAHELDFQCVVAGSAAEGLRLARQHHPVAVLLDISLPDQSGLTVLDMLKRDPTMRHVPIHVVSAHDHSQLALEMGAVGYALKPVKREKLVEAFRVLEERLSRTIKSVLVVEDDAVQREAISELLAADNVRIVAVETAEQALAELRRTTFDCAVVDLMLPQVSGFELLESMSSDDACAFPPVIIYTARTLTLEEEQKLRRYSKSIIIKGARSPERLLEEVTLFLHQVESDLPPDHQRMLRVVRDREKSLEGRRILLVEDDVRNIFALSSMLEPRGVTVDVARNGREALARLEQPPPVDLVLMDLMMPEMDGLTATREIRRRANGNGSPPVIALTAKAMPDDRQQCLDAGASDYIAKPIDVDKLLSLLRVWMPRA